MDDGTLSDVPSRGLPLQINLGCPDLWHGRRRACASLGSKVGRLVGDLVCLADKALCVFGLVILGQPWLVEALHGAVLFLLPCFVYCRVLSRGVTAEDGRKAETRPTRGRQRT